MISANPHRILLLGAVLVLTATLPASASTLVVANKAEATVSLIHLGSGEVIATLPTGKGPHEVGLAADGIRALVTNYGVRDEDGSSMTLIDVVKAEVVKTIDLGEYRRPHGVEWLDANHAAVTAESNKALLKVDVEQGKVVSAIDTDQEISHMLALGPSSRAFIANIGSGSMTVVDLAKGERVANVETGEGAEGVAVAGGHVWVTNRAADTVTVYDTKSLELVKSFASEGFPIRARSTPRGQVLVTRARAGDMAIYDAENLSEVRVVKFDLKAAGFEGRLFRDRFGDSSVPIGVVVDEAGDRAWVAHANADVITEVDLVKGEITRLLKAGREPDGMAYSTRGVDRP